MEIFRFENGQYLWGLALIPAAGLLFWWAGRWKKRALAHLGTPELLRALVPELSIGRPRLKNFLWILSFACLVVAMANPQVGSKLETVKREGVELIIALDVSNSMLAEDIQPNRLEKAKQAIFQLIRRLENDKIGLIVFAGEAYTQLPITTDYNAANMFLRSVNTDIVPTQGTAIGAAIELASQSFSSEASPSKVIVVITDGENHEDDAVAQAQAAAELGIVVHTVGMGLPQGAPIPYMRPNGQMDYRRDREGAVVMTKLNEAALQEIANAGGGVYVRSSNSSVGLELLQEKIAQMDKQEFESRTFSSYEDRFPIFIGLALFFLLLDLLILPRKNRWLSQYNIFKWKI